MRFCNKVLLQSAEKGYNASTIAAKLSQKTGKQWSTDDVVDMISITMGNNAKNTKLDIFKIGDGDVYIGKQDDYFNIKTDNLDDIQKGVEIELNPKLTKTTKEMDRLKELADDLPDDVFDDINRNMTGGKEPNYIYTKGKTEKDGITYDGTISRNDGGGGGKGPDKPVKDQPVVKVDKDGPVEVITRKGAFFKKIGRFIGLLIKNKFWKIDIPIIARKKWFKYLSDNIQGKGSSFWGKPFKGMNNMANLKIMERIWGGLAYSPLLMELISLGAWFRQRININIKDGLPSIEDIEWIWTPDSNPEDNYQENAHWWNELMNAVGIVWDSNPMGFLEIGVGTMVVSVAKEWGDTEVNDFERYMLMKHMCCKKTEDKVVEKGDKTIIIGGWQQDCLGEKNPPNYAGCSFPDAPPTCEEVYKKMTDKEEIRTYLGSLKKGDTDNSFIMKDGSKLIWRKFKRWIGVEVTEDEYIAQVKDSIKSVLGDSSKYCDSLTKKSPSMKRKIDKQKEALSIEVQKGLDKLMEEKLKLKIKIALEGQYIGMKGDCETLFSVGAPLGDLRKGGTWHESDFAYWLIRSYGVEELNNYSDDAGGFTKCYCDKSARGIQSKQECVETVMCVLENTNISFADDCWECLPEDMKKLNTKEEQEVELSVGKEG